jgi:galactokinase
MMIRRPPYGAVQEFNRLFGLHPRIFRAPGRINLIGEHTDYNDGFVMPAAIDFATWVVAERRADRKVVAHSLAFDSSAEFELGWPLPNTAPPWSRLVWAVGSALEKRGEALHGANLLIEGNVPMGAGLSSSASMEVALALCLAALSDQSISSKELALIAQSAEIESTGARVGIMDQFVSVHGEKGKVLLLDCRSLDYQSEPLPSDLELVICNTMIKHSIAGSEYNQRRAECEQGVKILQNFIPDIRALRDVSLAQLREFQSSLPEVVFRRCRHVISENERVQTMAGALNDGDERRIGELMHVSHQSLRDDYEVSCPELDIMVEAASKAPGVVGARMTGGGFGGCTVNLVRRGRTQEFTEFVANAYRGATGIAPEIFVTATADGAAEWKQPALEVKESS